MVVSYNIISLFISSMPTFTRVSFSSLSVYCLALLTYIIETFPSILQSI